MKLILASKRKSNVKIISKCDALSLSIITCALVKETINKLNKETGISKERAKIIIRETLEESVFKT